MASGAPPTRIGPFESVEDSPFLRMQMRALESDVDELRERTAKFAKDCAKYRDGLEDAYANELNFSESIKGFYGSLGDPFGNAVGGAILDRFMSSVQEIADARSMLLGAVESELCERLRRLHTLDLKDVHDARKRFDRCSAEYERARARFLSLTKDAKAESLKHAEDELHATRQVFETARFELMSQLHAADSRKRVEFKRRLALAMDAHLRFFALGHRILTDLEPFAHEVLQRCEEEEAAHAAERDALASAMADYQVSLRTSELGEAPSDFDALSLTSDRSRALAAVMRGEDERWLANVNGTVGAGGSAGDAGTGDAAVAADAGRSGAAESSAAATSAAASASASASASVSASARASARHVRAPSSGGVGGSAVLTQGYLLKRSSNMRADWKRRYFVLDALGHLTYYRGDRDVRSGSAKETVRLLTATIKPDLEDAPNMRFCFRVVSPEKTYCLQAESQTDRARWMEAITTAIAGLLNNADAIHASVSAISSPPPRSPERSRFGRSASGRSHSRSSSFGFGGGSHARSMSFGSALGGEYAATDADGEPSGDVAGVGGGHARHLSATSVGSVGHLGDADGRATLAELRSAPGNDACADCGMVDPDWASLNLGVMLCIQCGGVHRQLGVHVSKVRSCTLDVRAWEPSVVDMFRKWGNARANALWEGGGVGAGGDRVADEKGDGDGVTRGDGDGDGDGDVLRRVADGVDSSANDASRPPTKPSATDSLDAKRAYITAKYVHRAYVSSPDGDYGWQSELASACATGDVALAMEAVARGADANGGGGGPDRDLPLLHVAAEGGRDAVVEALLQNGADVRAKDAEGRTALHACVEGHADACAKLLIRRGASVEARDVKGRTALDAAMERGSVKDEELFLMLSNVEGVDVAGR